MVPLGKRDAAGVEEVVCPLDLHAVWGDHDVDVLPITLMIHDEIVEWVELPIPDHELSGWVDERMGVHRRLSPLRAIRPCPDLAVRPPPLFGTGPGPIVVPRRQLGYVALVAQRRAHQS